MDGNVNIGVTVTSRLDSGRDAIGKYRLGPIDDQISLDFALEAKSFGPDNGIG